MQHQGGFGLVNSGLFVGEMWSTVIAHVRNSLIQVWESRLMVQRI